MWEVKEEGIIKGKPSDIALLIGAKKSEFNRFLREAVTHSFANVQENNGIVTIVCRRMNKAYIEREKAKKRMKKYRSKKSDANVTEDVTTHSSSSSSSSKNKPVLFPIPGKKCGKCKLPAVYCDSSGSYDRYLCLEHSPPEVREKYR